MIYAWKIVENVLYDDDDDGGVPVNECVLLHRPLLVRRCGWAPMFTLSEDEHYSGGDK